MFSKRQLGRMYLPVLMDNAASILLGIVTSIMLSILGEHVISAVSMVNTIVNISNVFIGGVTTGAIVKVSQHIGAKDMDMCKKTSRQAIVISVLLAFVMSSLMFIFANGIVQLLFGNADEKILDTAKLYFRLYVLSSPFFALFSTSNGIMYGTGDFKRTMKNSLMINISHVLISAFFIYVLDLGVVGAGISYILCRALCGIYVYHGLRKGTHFIQVESALTKPDVKIIWSVLRIGLPAAMDSLIVNGSNLIVQTCIVALGSTALAAHSIISNLNTFIVLAGTAVSSMSVTVIGQCFGARDIKQCRKYMRLLIFVGWAFTLISAAVCYVFADELLGLYKPTQETFNLAKQVFMLILAFYAVLWAPAFMPPACLRGCGDVKYSATVSIMSLTVVKLPAVWLFTTQLNMGLMGIWMSVAAEWITRIVFITPRIMSHKWERTEKT